MRRKPKDGAVLKSDVIWIIQDYIRHIQMNGGNNSISQLYAVMKQIEDMPVREARWLKGDDNSWNCSHCGYKFWNATSKWISHCENCGCDMRLTLEKSN